MWECDHMLWEYLQACSVVFSVQGVEGIEMMALTFYAFGWSLQNWQSVCYMNLAPYAFSLFSIRF